MFKSILVPLDGSQFGEFPLALAAAWSEALPARLELVTVATPYLAPVALYHDVDVPASTVVETQRAAEYLASVADRYRNRGLEVRYTVLEGANVADEILAYAAEHDVGLVMAATHGRGPLSRVWLGSVADSLLRQATVPLLLMQPDGGKDAKPTVTDKLENILVPLDGTPDSESAVKVADQLARVFGSALTLFHAVQLPTTTMATSSPYLPHTALDMQEVAEIVEASDDRLEAMAASLRATGHTVRIKTVVDRAPGPAIVHWIEDHKPDLTVMASEGRDGLFATLTRSVTDKVVRGARCPVLAVPARKRTED